MDVTSTVFAKIAGLLKSVDAIIKTGARFVSKEDVQYFERYNNLAIKLRDYLPELYDDIVIIDLPELHNPKYFEVTALWVLKRHIEYVLEVRANSRIGEKRESTMRREYVFISHGRSMEWHKVQAYVERDLGIKTIELAQQPNVGRTILQKLDEETNNCFAAIIAMTGDDIAQDGEVRARENVLHEIGFLQGKLGLNSIILLHEESVNIPSNIHGLVYIPFPKGLVDATFGALQRELKVIAG